MQHRVCTFIAICKKHLPKEYILESFSVFKKALPRLNMTKKYDPAMVTKGRTIGQASVG